MELTGPRKEDEVGKPAHSFSRLRGVGRVPVLEELEGRKVDQTYRL
jgi:hypothetical protein